MIVEAYHLCGTDELAELDAQAQQLMVKTRVAHWLDEHNFLHGTLNGVSHSFSPSLPCAHTPAH
jgi:hypothetical protein